MTATLVIGPYIKTPEDMPWQEKLAEAVNLSHAIDLDVIHSRIIMLNTPSPATYIGSGNVDTLKEMIEHESIKLVIMDTSLAPIQQRNLEKIWKAKVIDRTGLILEIFGKRARTMEGSLQVELAALQYQRSRLVRSWSHLERQRGGFGFIGGPGESQLELDRRMIDTRIKKIKSELEKTVRTRRLQRTARERVPYPIVALVGYTNAGKSTLFNALTGEQVMAKDMLFATLDPTMRQIKLPSGQRVILSDTVGFISDLPTTLVAAFRATLEEVIEADVIVHVRDISSPYAAHQKEDVEKVLGELGVISAPHHKEAPESSTQNHVDKASDVMSVESMAQPIVEVWNKIDLLNEEMRLKMDALCASAPDNESSDEAVPLLLSAHQAAHDQSMLTPFKKCLDVLLHQRSKRVHVVLSHDQGELLAWCYEKGAVMQRNDQEDGIHLELGMSPSMMQRFLERQKRDAKDESG